MPQGWLATAIFHPFLWDGRKLSDLGTLGGENGAAIWVNNSGEVVGSAQLHEELAP